MDGGEKNAPKLWIERQYTEENMLYGMFIVFPDWYNRFEDEKDKTYKYDEIKIQYESKLLSFPSSRNENDFEKHC